MQALLPALALLAVSVGQHVPAYTHDNGVLTGACSFTATAQSTHNFSFNLSAAPRFEDTYHIPTGPKSAYIDPCGDGFVNTITEPGFSGQCNKSTSTGCLCHPDTFGPNRSHLCGSIASSSTREWFVVSNATIGLHFTAPSCFVDPSKDWNTVVLLSCGRTRTMSEIGRQGDPFAQWCWDPSLRDFCSPCYMLSDPTFCNPSFCASDRDCGHGHCIMNRCKCDDGWKGPFCGQAPDPPAPSPVPAPTPSPGPTPAPGPNPTPGPGDGDGDGDGRRNNHVDDHWVPPVVITCVTVGGVGVGAAGVILYLRRRYSFRRRPDRANIGNVPDGFDYEPADELHHLDDGTQA